MHQTTYYITYLTACTALIFWLARILHHAGGIFLAEAFHGNSALTKAVAQLLDVGYYLISFGYVATSLRAYLPMQDYAEMGWTGIMKLGWFLLLLGFVHLFNMLLLALFRRRPAAATAQAAS